MQGGRALILVALIMGCAGAAHADLSTGLIAHYELDGNALDSSTHANHGTAGTTLVATTDRFGTAAAAYEFNGTNSYITVPNSSSLSSPTTAITMSAWIMLYGNSHVGSPFSPILMKSNSGSNAFMYRMLAAPTYFGAAYNNWNLTQSAAATLPASEWHHVATTFDGARHRFYFDGAEVSDQALALTITTDTRPLLIGADVPGFFECFWGKIDDLRIYNRTLSGAEIQELYSGPVDVGELPGEKQCAIRRTFPNPTPGGVTLEYALATTSPVELVIHDVHGRRIRALSIGMRPSGIHSVVWDGRTDSGSLAGTGVFWMRLSTRRSEVVTRVVRIQ